MLDYFEAFRARNYKTSICKNRLREAKNIEKLQISLEKNKIS